MTRAIVWLCWGEEFIRDAIESARSTLAIEADRVLITDTAGALRATDSKAFSSVIPIELIHRNNLEKSRLVDLIPQGYDTFLYLDTDTRIIGDVTLGFNKAEQHGIAMAPAPNYNLNEYFNFARLMPQLGVEPADQFMFNAGIIYFHLTPAVRQVLERWRDLAAVGVGENFTHDQPFLTLAMEQLGYTPYVLSPLYNYRGLGEYAVGKIRTWHSHFPLPSDVNDFKEAWPARRFKDGIRFSSDVEEAENSNAKPQGMFDLALPKARILRRPGATQSFVEDVLTIQKDRGSQAANEFLLEHIGVKASPDRNESYFAEALHYHLGLLQAHAGVFERMAWHLRMSHTMPSSENDQLFSDHVNLSHVLRTAQLRGIARGLPPVLMACMPRSSSATLTYTLGRAIGAPVLHIGAGQFPNIFLAPSWLDMFLEGGAITQDHFGASDFNVGVLNGRSLRDVFVLIRDPRAAARSQVHYLARGSNDTGKVLQSRRKRISNFIPWLQEWIYRAERGETPQERIERECIANFIPWLQGWIDLAKRADLPFRVHFITYRETCENLAGAICKISTILQDGYPAMSEYSAIRKVEEVRMHFVTGNDDAWRAETDSATRGRLWAACSSDMKSLLNLQW
jgi:hypothetical protein